MLDDHPAHPGNLPLPSGHVAGSTLVYGLLVVLAFRARDARVAPAGPCRAVAAIGLVASHGCTGVHYFRECRRCL